MNFVECNELKYEYKSFEGEREVISPALRGVSLTVREGEFVAILGHNGSGKSTLAKLINCLLLPSGGSLCVGGIAIFDGGKAAAEGEELEELAWRVRQQAGMVFQNPDNQLIASIVEEDVAFGAENLGIEPEEIKKRVAAALKRVRMEKYRLASPYELSGGQKQRVAIAGILAMKPKCIILDEATAMLDPIGREEVMQTVLRLNKQEGITVIAITHDMSEAVDADRLIIVENGKAVMSGAPKEIFSNEQSIEKIRAVGLDIPKAAELAEELRKNGMELPMGLLTEDALVAEIQAANIDKEKIGLYTDNAADSPNTSEIIMSVKNLSHFYAKGTELERAALRDISFDIKRGEFIGIIGHTGSGKSTLIQHLNGLMKADSGEIIFEGEPIGTDKKRLKELRQRVGMVFQYPEYQIFEGNVFDEIAFGPKNMGLDDDQIKQRVFYALRQTGLDESCCSLSPFNMSGGQKRRIAIASVLAMKPEILVLDEPLAGLDPQGRRELAANITALKSEGMTIIMISHDMDTIAELADRILVLGEGKKIALDTPREIFKNRQLLRKIGLEVPTTVSVLDKLRDLGYKIPSGIYGLKETAATILNAIGRDC